MNEKRTEYIHGHLRHRRNGHSVVVTTRSENNIMFYCLGFIGDWKIDSTLCNVRIQYIVHNRKEQTLALDMI